MSTAYYNEFDPGAARWLRELIHEGLIAPGVVDDRSIRDVRPDDLRGFAQCHFFAGIGVWSHALRGAGWADDEPVWTGSCPCQPFSAAGSQAGFEDPRHLWPEFFRLIAECRPRRIIGEQVASADAWLDLVRTDLEAHDYAFAAVDVPAAGFGGAHIRQRYYWVADADNAEWWADCAPRHLGDWPETGRVQGDGDAGERRELGRLADAAGGGCGVVRNETQSGRRGHDDRRLAFDRLAVSHGVELCGVASARKQPVHELLPGAIDGLDFADWLFCRDGRWRPVEAGTFPLASEASARMGRLRGYGNGLDAETATQFVAAYIDAAPLNWRAAA